MCVDIVCLVSMQGKEWNFQLHETLMFAKESVSAVKVHRIRATYTWTTPQRWMIRAACVLHNRTTVDDKGHLRWDNPAAVGDSPNLHSQRSTRGVTYILTTPKRWMIGVPCITTTVNNDKGDEGDCGFVTLASIRRSKYLHRDCILLDVIAKASGRLQTLLRLPRV